MSIKSQAIEALGELFIMGFPGQQLTAETIGFIKKARIGGVILFSHNYDNPRQVAELINHLQAPYGDLPLWVSVDHEGEIGRAHV